MQCFSPHLNSYPPYINPMDEEYDWYWETNAFLDNQELDRCSNGSEEVAITGFSDSSPGKEGSTSTNRSSSPSTKNIILGRKRRKRANERLYALRSVVPKITRMDKASILKDAIQYIQELQEQERRMETEISKLEEAAKDRKPVLEVDTEDNEVEGGKKIGCGIGHSRLPPPPPSFLPTEVNVIKVGDGLFSVRVACNKNKDTMVKLCEALRPVKLSIIGANMTSLSGRLLHTLFVECDGVQEELKEKIGMAIGDFGFLPLEHMCCSSI